LAHKALWLYNCKDVRATYECATALRETVSKLGLQEQLAFQMDQWHLAQAMADRGIAVNPTRWGKIKGELTAAANSLEQFLLDCMPANTRFTAMDKPWFTSPKMTMDIFYRQLGLPQVTHRKTKQPTVSGEALGELKKKVPHLAPIFSALEALRSISVFRSHFIEAKLSPDRRLRCTFYVGGTDTFRWSSSSNSFDEGTNLQNIPKGDE
jgi:DNA polymerase I-like protein with 3'-5' exonuclease and polymerase domains